MDIYIGIFIDDESKQLLLNQLKSLNIEIPNDWKLYLHHITLCFNKHDEISNDLYSYYESLIGDEITVIAKTIGITNDIIAAGIDTYLPVQNDIPHITIACAEGIPPVRSNYITNWENISNLKLTGKIQMFKKRDTYKKLQEAISEGIMKALNERIISVNGINDTKLQWMYTGDIFEIGCNKYIIYEIEDWIGEFQKFYCYELLTGEEKMFYGYMLANKLFFSNDTVELEKLHENDIFKINNRKYIVLNIDSEYSKFYCRNLLSNKTVYIDGYQLVNKLENI